MSVLKRGRGRPKGSKNKKTLARMVANGSADSGTDNVLPKRPVGRPPKDPSGVSVRLIFSVS